MNNKLEELENNEVLKEILNDSMGGILYNVANRDKYDTKELLKLWESLSISEQNSVGGLIEGAIKFVSEGVN